MQIAVLGGTGRQGYGLAMRWARAGHQTFVRSRSPARAAEVARSLNAGLEGDGGVVGLANQAAAGESAVLIGLDPRHGVKGAGIRITGLNT